MEGDAASEINVVLLRLWKAQRLARARPSLLLIAQDLARHGQGGRFWADRVRARHGSRRVRWFVERAVVVRFRNWKKNRLGRVGEDARPGESAAMGRVL